MQYDDDFRRLAFKTNSTTVDQELDTLGNVSSKTKSTNPFLNSPDDESAPCGDVDGNQREAIFSADASEVTWM